MASTRPYFHRYKPLRKWVLAFAMRRTARRIDDAKAALFDILAVWKDDQTVADEMDRRIGELDQWLEEFKASVHERLDAGEHVGP